METRIYPNESIGIYEAEDQGYLTVENSELDSYITIGVYGQDRNGDYLYADSQLTVDEAEALISMLQQRINIIKRNE